MLMNAMKILMVVSRHALIMLAAILALAFLDIALQVIIMDVLILMNVVKVQMIVLRFVQTWLEITHVPVCLAIIWKVICKRVMVSY